MDKGKECIGVSVIFLCHDGKGNFLLSKRSPACRDEHGTWDPGGGAVELHDTIENTLRKEIKEEYCADVISHEFLGFRDVHRVNNGANTHWIALDFKVLINPAQAKNGEPHKLAEIKWFTTGTLPTPVHSQFPYFLKKYEGRI